MRTYKTISALFACSLLIGTAVASPDFEQNIEKTFQVTPGGHFILQADRGSVDVKTDEGNQVQVHLYRKVSGGSKANADEQFANHEVTLTQDGNKLVVVAKNKTNKYFSWSNNRPGMEVRYVINVPKKFDVDLKTAGGNIQLADLDGEALAREEDRERSLARTIRTGEAPCALYTAGLKSCGDTSKGTPNDVHFIQTARNT